MVDQDSIIEPVVSLKVFEAVIGRILNLNVETNMMKTQNMKNHTMINHTDIRIEKTNIIIYLVIEQDNSNIIQVRITFYFSHIQWENICTKKEFASKSTTTDKLRTKKCLLIEIEVTRTLKISLNQLNTKWSGKSNQMLYKP